jgi:hypothetical protein
MDIGDSWLDAALGTLLVVPSVIVTIGPAADRNVLINHRHADARRVRIVGS